MNSSTSKLRVLTPLSRREAAIEAYRSRPKVPFNALERERIARLSLVLQEIGERGNTVTIEQEWMPRTTLESDAYDLVICSDLIAYSPREDHRLFVAELSRIVKRDGFVVCATPIDVHSEDALQRLAALLGTEFHAVRWLFSYHRLAVNTKSRTLLLALERLARFIWEEEAVTHAIFVGKRKPLL